jgi:hypothetical protein
MSLIRRRVVVGIATLALLVRAGAAFAICSANVCHFGDLPASCCGATSCTLDGTITVTGATCDLNFNGRNVTLSGTLNLGSTPAIPVKMLTIEAGSFRVTGVVNGAGTSPNPGAVLTIMTTGGTSPAFSVASSSSGGIKLGGYGAGGGTLTVHADGPIALTGGSIDVRGLEDAASGGTIEMDTRAGAVTVGIALLADAGLNGNGGTIDLEAASDLSVTDTGSASAQTGAGFGGEIDLIAPGAVRIAGAATVNASAINGGAGDGADVNIAGGSVTVNGFVAAKGGKDPTGDIGGSGGNVDVEADTGALLFAGNALQGVITDGAPGGDGGTVSFTTLSAKNGDLTIGAPVSNQGMGGELGRPGGGGEIDVSSAARLLITRSINVGGTGGSTGVADIFGQLDVVVQDSIIATDTAGGGLLDIASGHDLTFVAGTGNKLKANATTDGTGGAIVVSAANDLALTGFVVDAGGAGLGAGGSISFDAGRNLVVDHATAMNANSATGSGREAGNILLDAGSPDLAGNLQIDGDITATGHGPGPGLPPAQIELSGCQVTIGSTGSVNSAGDVGASNLVTGRTGITINGKLLTTDAAHGGKNVPTYPNGTTPVVSGSNSKVSPTFFACPGGCAKPVCTAPGTPAGCLVPCPVCGNGQTEFPEQCDPSGCPNCDQHCRLFAAGGCSDGNPCTVDACQSVKPCLSGGSCGSIAACVNEPAAIGTACDDSNLCNGHETCTVVAATELCESSGDLDCDDDNPCTADTCDATTGCVHTPAANGIACSGCKSAGTCQGGVCVSGTPLDCDDDNACTIDACDEALGCVHTPIAGCEPCAIAADCNDGNFCTTDGCMNGVCEHDVVADCCGTDEDCDDRNPCTMDSKCDTVHHTCTHTPLSGPEPGCGDECTPGTCTSGSCSLGSPNQCATPPDVCTVALCDPAVGCTSHTVLPPDCCTSDTQCSDGDVCTNDTCDPEFHVCVNALRFLGCRTCTTDVDCDPLGACGQSICDAAGGTCVDHVPPNCTDGNTKTQDVCLVDGPGAAHCENRCLCDDHDACNGVETCGQNVCNPGTPLECDDHDSCTDDMPCDPSAGCVHVAKIGFDAVGCHLDAIASAVGAAPGADIAKSVRTKLTKLVAKTRGKLASAKKLGSGKKALKALKAVGTQLKAIANAAEAARRKDKIDGALADVVSAAARGAGDALETLKTSLTPAAS